MRGGSPVSGLAPGREADSRGTIREIADSGLPDNGGRPSFRTIAGKCGSGRKAGLLFLSQTGLFP